MTASPAEQRMRDKAEAALREAWPDARIVHELMLHPDGCRIDLAAITENRLIVVEIKSEFDDLTRLKRQALQAADVADQLTVVVAEKHWRSAWENGHARVEDVTQEDDITPHLLSNAQRELLPPTNVEARLEMLWSTELHKVAGVRKSRAVCIAEAMAKLSSEEVRNRVCAALRARPFACADQPILSTLFPKPTKGRF